MASSVDSFLLSFIAQRTFAIISMGKHMVEQVDAKVKLHEFLRVNLEKLVNFLSKIEHNPQQITNNLLVICFHY